MPDLVLLGIKVGEYTDWDELGPISFIVSDFKPNKVYQDKIPVCYTMEIDYDAGIITQYYRNERMGSDIKILEVLK